MKSFILSAILASAVLSTEATASPMIGIQLETNVSHEDHEDNKAISEFKNKLEFTKENLEVLWKQYNLAVANVKKSSGSHAELDADYTYFTNLYKEDIKNGFNVKEAEKTLEELKKIYTEKHTLRNEEEQAKIYQLSVQLEKKLQKESKVLKKIKNKNSDLLTDDVLPLVAELEKYFSQSLAKVDGLKEASSKQDGYYAKL